MGSRRSPRRSTTARAPGRSPCRSARRSRRGGRPSSRPRRCPRGESRCAVNGVCAAKSMLGSSGAYCSKRAVYVPDSSYGPCEPGDASPRTTISPSALGFFASSGVTVVVGGDWPATVPPSPHPGDAGDQEDHEEGSAWHRTATVATRRVGCAQAEVHMLYIGETMKSSSLSHCWPSWPSWPSPRARRPSPCTRRRRCVTPSRRSTERRPTASWGPTSCRRRSNAAHQPTSSRPRVRTRRGALFRAGLCTRPVTFATNVVVLITPKGNPSQVRSVYSLRTGSRRLSVGTAGVPIGAYTRQVLARLRLTSILRSNRVSLDPNVAAITSKVALGSADAGFVYATDAEVGGRPHRHRVAAEVGAAAGPLRDVRRAPRRCRHRRRERLHREGQVHQRPPDPQELRVRPTAAAADRRDGP